MTKFLMSLVGYFKWLLLSPFSTLAVFFQSERQRWRTANQKPVVRFEEAYDGRRVMLLALYEKGELRPDVVRLLKAAQAEGLYVLAVNTLKLSNPEGLRGLVDCYIERPNFGRDFGSYQTGFLHFFDREWHKECPRLLLLNDSVFFSREKTPPFLTDMMTSDVEVLGSTENFDFGHHLGSFCIAMSGEVMRKPRFETYWRKYRLSDIRTTVIQRGERQLSKTLLACTSDPENFRALYDSSHFLKSLRADPSLPDFVIKNSRTCDIIFWDQVGAERVLSILSERYLVPVNQALEEEAGEARLQISTDIDALQKVGVVQDVASLKAYVTRHVEDGSSLDAEVLDDAIIAMMVETFMKGSQIHQNAAPLLRIGLPIIKLDAIYRGTLNVYDVIRLTNLLGDDEGAELRRILMSRPYGSDVLFGWKQVAFRKGLL